MAMRIDSGFDLLSQGNRRADAVGQAVTALLGNVMARREAGRERQHETSMLEKEYGYKAANREAELTQLNKNALDLAEERGEWAVKAKGTGTPIDPNLSNLYGEQAANEQLRLEMAQKLFEDSKKLMTVEDLDLWFGGDIPKSLLAPQSFGPPPPGVPVPPEFTVRVREGITRDRFKDIISSLAGSPWKAKYETGLLHDLFGKYFPDTEDTGDGYIDPDISPLD